MIELKPCPFCGRKPHIDFMNKIVECVNPSCAVLPSTWKYDFVSEALDAMKPEGRTIFGGGFLISKAAAEELAEAYRNAAKNKAIQAGAPEGEGRLVWKLSPGELAAVAYLGDRRK